MQKNEYFDVEIISMSSDGAGVCRIDGTVVFVPFALVGDFLKVKILKVKKNIAFGKIAEVIRPSEFRVNPSCGSFGKCGGCSLLHMTYESQLEYKRNKVSEAIKRIGKLNVDIEKTVPSEPFGYRNKALIPVGKDKEGKLCAGFYRRQTHDIIPFEKCVIENDVVSVICKKVTEWMEETETAPYDSETGKGCVRHIYIRRAELDNKIMCGIVTSTEKLKNEGLLIEKLASVEGVSSVINNINKEKTNVILGNNTQVLWGEKYLTDTLLGKEFIIGSMSFYQINRNQCERLYKKAGELLQLTENDVLYDIYCGIGTIGISLGDKVKKLIGVEIVPEAVELARINAERNGIKNAEYYVGKAENMSFEGDEKPTAVVIDPPRKGCDPALIETLLKLEPEKICYISCDPATLARDLKIFSESGKYSIGTVYPFDMFPQTEHVEAVVLLQRLSLPDGK